MAALVIFGCGVVLVLLASVVLVFLERPGEDPHRNWHTGQGRKKEPRKMKRFLVFALLLLCACDVRGTVLIVGDSNTSLAAGIWQQQVYAGIWTEPSHVVAWLPTIVGVPMSALTDWAPSVASIAAAQSFDVSILALGVNDCAVKGVPPTDAELDALFAALPGRRVIIDAPYAPAVSYACLEQVNLALQRAVNRWGATYLNVNDVLNALPPTARYQADGLHYSMSAQVAIGQAIVAELEAP